MERLWTWITVWTLICSLTGFAPHCECYYFPLPLSNNSGHNERVWQKVKCLVINSFNWKKRGREREVPLQDQKAKGLEEGARLKSAWRPSPSLSATHQGGETWSLMRLSKINDSSTLNTPAQCHPPLVQPPWQFAARSYFGWSVRVARIPKTQK